MEEIVEWLSQKHGSKVGITVPQRGDRAQLVAMCKSNAAETLAQKKGATVREYNVLEELRDLLGLKNCPNISNPTIFQTLQARKMLLV